MIPASMLTPDGRRAWAFIALFGSALVFTAFIAWGLWHLRDQVDETFWLAVLAHVQLFAVILSFTWVLGRRMLFNLTRDGATIDDRHADQSDNLQS
ncbi:MAG: hypothetical protein ACRDBL_04720 [Rhabdaerophilum sp.]